jgi:hypothetical protein
VCLTDRCCPNPSIWISKSTKQVTKYLVAKNGMDNREKQTRRTNHLRAAPLSRATGWPLVEIDSAGVQHHGIDDEVLGMLLLGALLRLPLLDPHLPCNAPQRNCQHEQTKLQAPCARHFSPSNPTTQNEPPR